MDKTRTKGNVIIEDIELGQTLYEFEYGTGIETIVISKPALNSEGQWEWKGENVRTGEIINYLITPGMSHYGPNLYDHIAYGGVEWV